MNLLSLILMISILGCEFKEGENQIINGFDALQRDFNYHVSIFASSIYKCAGGIIDTIHVITAAHCVENFEAHEIIIITGVGNLTASEKVLRSVQYTHIHKNFHTDRWNNDIAVLKLYKPFVFGENIKAISLPSTPVPDEVKICWLTGIDANGIKDYNWKLLWIPLEFISPIACECIGGFELSPRVFCALDIAEAIKPTHGDSGGVLICEGVAIGIMCGRLESEFFSPNIFASIYENLNFIKTIISLTAD